MFKREKGFFSGVKNSFSNRGSVAYRSQTFSPDTIIDNQYASAQKLPQTINFAEIPDLNYGDTDLVLDAASTSGLPVMLTASGSCVSISGNIVHILQVGSCTITAQQLGNYQYDPAPEVSRTFKVLPAQLTVTADDKHAIYGAQIPRFTATIAGLVNGSESLGTLTFTTEAVLGSPAGKYEVVPKGLASENYQFKYLSGTLNITPAVLRVVAEDKQMTYGDALPLFTARAQGLMGVDTLESLGVLEFNSGGNETGQAGEYAISVAGIVSANYSIEYWNGTLTVLPAPLDIVVEDTESLFGHPLPEFRLRASGLRNGDTLADLGTPVYKTEAGEGSPAGKYAVKAGGFKEQNYHINYLEGTLTINQAELEVTVQDEEIRYGMPLPDFKSVIKGLVNGEDIEIISHDLIYHCDAAENSPAGVYAVKAAGLNSSTYKINYFEGKLRILPAPLRVEAEDKNITYGEPLPEFSVKVSGLVNGDTLEELGTLIFESEAREGSAAGTYPITPGGLTSPNYEYDFHDGALTITPARLIVTAENKTAIFGAPFPAFTANVTGLVNGDTMESLGSLIYDTPAVVGVPAGIYDIIPRGLTSNNYQYIYLSGKLVIMPDPTLEPKIEKIIAPDSNKPRIGEIMVNDGLITPQDLIKALGKQLDVQVVNLSTYSIDKNVLNLVNESLARKYDLIPLSINNGYLLVAMADPTNILAIEAVEAQSKMRIKPMMALAEEIQAAIDRSYKSFSDIAKEFTEVTKPVAEAILDEAVAEAPAVRTLGIIIEEAVKKRVSDIHIEPESDRVRLRYRIDGVMHEVMTLPFAAHALILSRLKVLSNMNIADHRPQDGQFSFKTRDKEVDVRVATIATTYGEMGTLRILDKSFAVRTLDGIGFKDENLKKYHKMLRSPFGMVLVSGPTGSGKTTTLYASLNSMDRDELKIITIEDPVEYHFDGISQIQVNNRGGLSFAAGLRSMMRHDPDVALVGEIRDAETASVSVQAALTGHLVLASIHANDSVGVIYRLLDLGVEPFLVASALMGVVSQRMVRRVCPHCRKPGVAPIEVQAAYFEETGEKRETFDYGEGCSACANTGYLGRIAVMEILTMSEEIRRMLLSDAGTDRIRSQAQKEGMFSMRHDGMLKVKEGITTPNEILKNVFSIG